MLTQDTITEVSQAMLSSAQTRWLVHDLCARLGFCLPAAAVERLETTPPETVSDFVAAIFVAEGLDPMTAERRLYRRVEAIVAEAFRRSESEDAPAL
jgi:hypothetical protein